MELCAKCKKRPAVVFITRLDQGNSINEGLCLRCARELGIKPVDSMLEKMGLTDEDLDRMDEEMQSLIEQPDPDEDTDLTEESNAETDNRNPAIDFRKLFGPAMFGAQNAPNGEKSSRQEKKAAKKELDKRKYLNLYASDLSKKAKEGKLDRIVGRERELERVIQILCRRQKNNPCLIGEPGVGKTALAEALAQKIAAGQVPYRLQNKEVHVLDLTALVAGTQFRGQFESRIKGLIDEVRALGNIILMIDEVHSIVGAGDAEGSMNAANILKPALSKGEIQILGATTLNEYRKYIENDSALERRFQPVILEEPSIEDTVEILRGIKGYYESFHGITIPDDTVRRCVTLSERYITDRFLPDKAIDLMDEAASYLAIHSPCISELEALKAELDSIRAQQESLESQPEEEDSAKQKERYQKLADLKTREMQGMSRFDQLSDERDGIALSTADLAQVIEIWTGIPASNITEHEFARLDRLDARLREHIVGQDEAVSAVTRAIKRSRAGVSSQRKPVSFIFAGPTGVGKTALVKTLAADLFDSPETLIRLDMSEFMEKHAVSRLIGSPPGYVGYDDAGQLTEKIRRKPYSVILFDEIEKAHPDVLNILLQVLDDGRITDAHGRTVNFENCVIVMTTNAGSSTGTPPAGFGQSAHQAAQERTMRALSDFLRPEFINRVDEIITFRALDENDFATIARIMLEELRRSLSEKDILFTYTEQAARHIAHASFDRKYGARNMRRYIQTHVEDEIATRVISHYAERIRTVHMDVSNNTLTFTCMEELPALKNPTE